MPARMAASVEAGGAGRAAERAGGKRAGGAAERGGTGQRQSLEQPGDQACVEAVARARGVHRRHRRQADLVQRGPVSAQGAPLAELHGT
jgi:hypothetical protein